MKVAVGIVGAGPAGLLVANVLVRAGIDVVVFERLSEVDVRARTRAGLIEARTVSLLDRHRLAEGLHTKGSTSHICEFRRNGVAHLFDYGSLSGAVHGVYPQQMLVADLIDALHDAGGQIRFECPVSAVVVGERPAIVLGGSEQVACDFVLGCDGFHGVCRPAMAGVACHGADFGARWIVLLAESPPSREHTLYGLHRDGFAGQMLRTKSTSRFYVQVPAGEDPDLWPEERIWETLQVRLQADGEEVEAGRIIERSVLELRSYISEPLQEGRVFLAGDAAHIVTPAGGKGMNLALQDADTLVAGLLDYYRCGDDRRLDSYSAERLPPIRRSVEFSHWMLDLLLARPEQGPFREGLRDARLDTLLAAGDFARHFSARFVGAD